MGGGSTGLSFGDLEAISENVSGINGVSAEQNTTQDVRAGGVTLESISIVGTTTDFPAVRELTVGEGRFINDEDTDRSSRVAVLGYSIAQELFGDGIVIGQQITVGSGRFTIVGVLEDCRWRIKGGGNAAERLGLKPSTLRYRMKKLGIQRPPTRPR